MLKLRGITLALVKGAGHVIPKDKKKEAAVLLKASLNSESLPDNPNWLKAITIPTKFLLNLVHFYILLEYFKTFVY